MKHRKKIHIGRCLLYIMFVALLLVTAENVPAQDQAITPVAKLALSRDEKLSQLKTRQAELELDRARVDMDRTELELKDTKSLYEDNIVTANEYRKAEQAHEEAKIVYEQAENRLEQTRLEFLKNATLIRITSAKIFRGENGEVMASIELQNDSNIRKARVVMNQSDADYESLETLLKVDNVIVTLWATTSVSLGNSDVTRSAKAIIGEPFQQIIPALEIGKRETLKFQLLKREIEQVAVQIEYLDIVKEYNVFLAKEAMQDLPTITSAQFDQRGDLGTTINFNLQLERLAKTEQGFGLRVLNFPEEMRFDFIDPETKASMTTLKFGSEQSIKTMNFRVRIPEKLDRSLIDTSISFYIIVARPGEMEMIHELKKRFAEQKIPPEEIAKIKGNVVELVLIPQGVGKLDILVGNLFKEIQQDSEDIELKFRLLNTGTLGVRQVRPTLDLPLEWEAELSPEEVKIVEPDQKVLFVATIRPPLDVAVGEYTIKMETEGYSGVEIIEAAEKDFTIRVVAESNITGTLVLVALLGTLVLGIAIASVKISRR